MLPLLGSLAGFPPAATDPPSVAAQGPAHLDLEGLLFPTWPAWKPTLRVAAPQGHTQRPQDSLDSVGAGLCLPRGPQLARASRTVGTGPSPCPLPVPAHPPHNREASSQSPERQWVRECQGFFRGPLMGDCGAQVDSYLSHLSGAPLRKYVYWGGGEVSTALDQIGNRVRQGPLPTARHPDLGSGWCPSLVLALPPH